MHACPCMCTPLQAPHQGSLAAGALLLALSRPALSFWCAGAASAETLVATGHAYLAVRAVGAPINTSLSVAQAACRGIGQPRLPLRATIVANAVNLALDPLLIFSLRMGLGGAAWATVCGQVWPPLATCMHVPL